MNRSPWRGWLNSSRWSSAWWRLDEQEPVDEQSQVEAGGGRRWMNSSPWRLEAVDGGDEQYPVESRFAVRHTPPDEQDPRFDRSTPTQVCFLSFAVRHTPPDQQDPRFDRRKSVSSVLRYATPLPMDTTPILNVVGRTQGRFLHSAVRQASLPSPVPSQPSR